MEVATDAGATAPANEAVVSTPIENAAPETTTTDNQAAAPSLDDALSAAWDKMHAPAAPRGPDGKFLPRETTAAAPETSPEAQAAEAATTTEISAGQPEEAKVETATPSIDPPPSWPAEGKALFATLPPEFRKLQEIAATRDKEQNDAISRLGDQSKAHESRIKTYEPIEQLFKAHEADFARHGVRPEQGVQALLAAQRALDANPRGTLAQLAAQYGIDPRQPLHADDGQQQHTDPVTAQLHGRIQQQDAKIAQLEGKMTAQERAAYQVEQSVKDAELASLNKVITDFAHDKPHFAKVEPIIMGLLQSNAVNGATPKERLQSAYDKAVWADPEVRERILADQRKAETEKTAELAKTRAEAARKAASVNVKSAPAQTATPKSWTDTLQATADRLYGNG